MRALLIMLGMLIGCDGGVASDCRPATNAVVAMYATSAEFVPLIEARCQDDHWGDELARCLLDPKRRDNRSSCAELYMTAHQREKLDDAIALIAAPAIAEQLAASERDAATICACKDYRCADDAWNQAARQAEVRRRSYLRPVRLPESARRRAIAISDAMQKCMAATRADR